MPNQWKGAIEKIRHRDGPPIIDVAWGSSLGVLFEEEAPSAADLRLDAKLSSDEGSIGSIRTDNSDIDFDAK